MSGGRRPGGAPAAPVPLPTAAQAGALHHRLLDWYAANRRDLPWRRTVDPYAVLVSEVMLQQTQVSRVAARFGDFLAAYPTLEALAAAPTAELLRQWSGLGYNARAVRLQRGAQTVAEGTPAGAPARLPQTLDELGRLPGIGPYTARAVLIFAHNADLAAVDANVRRVLTHELELPPDLSAAALQAVADAVLPAGRARDWHNALMDYGALVLTARATGIAPRTRQGRFEGSSRWHRSRLLKLLMAEGPRTAEQLRGRLGLDAARFEAVAAGMLRDGLILRRGDTLQLP